jgi:heptose I phosphotransferase
MTSAGLEFETWDAGRLHVNRQFCAVLEANFLTTFAALYDLPGGDVVRAIDNRSTARVVFSRGGQEQAFYLKRHASPRLLDRLKPLLHLSLPILGARHEWRAILRFHATGIPTMTPVAFGEFQSRSLVMTRDLGTDLTLLDWVNEYPGGRPERTAGELRLTRDIMRRVAQIARRMHDSGLHHQDFYLNHLLCCGELSGLDIRVIDLGRVRSRGRLSQRWIIKDLAQLDFSARRLPCSHRLRFLRLYLGRPFRSADRWLIRQIALKSRSIAAHTAKNDL